MKVKYIAVCLSAILLTQCIDIASFKPPPRYFKWRAPQYLDINYSEPGWLYQYADKRDKDMKSCGMDPFDGESIYPDVNLCLEAKGWYLKEGPYCENESVWNRPLCIEWRKKYSKPDAKPWAPKKD